MFGLQNFRLNVPDSSMLNGKTARTAEMMSMQNGCGILSIQHTLLAWHIVLYSLHTNNIYNARFKEFNDRK